MKGNITFSHTYIRVSNILVEPSPLSFRTGIMHVWNTTTNTETWDIELSLSSEEWRSNRRHRHKTQMNRDITSEKRLRLQTGISTSSKNRIEGILMPMSHASASTPHEPHFQATGLSLAGTVTHTFFHLGGLFTTQSITSLILIKWRHVVEWKAVL